MGEEQMRRALELISQARKLRKQLDEFVLLKRDHHNRGETIQVGDPVQFKSGEYHRLDVPIPESARRMVFNMWRKETAQKYNAILRELNQLGANHGLSPVTFSTATGEPSHA